MATRPCFDRRRAARTAFMCGHHYSDGACGACDNGCVLNFRVARAALVAAVSSALAMFGAAVPAVADGSSALSIVNARVCATNAPGAADCLAIRHDLIERATGKPVQMSATSGFSSTAIRTAYGISGVGSANIVIAIVDAYDAPTAASDLTAYRAAMGLPSISTSCAVTSTTIDTTAGPCFVKVGQTGSTTSLPRADRGWAQEIDLDLQMASTVCPNCSILLVEANSSSITNLNASVATAASFTGVKAISNSYGGSDMSQSSASAYNAAAAKGIAVTASTGDSGYGDSFPASSSNVIAVGGTSLTVSSSTGVRTAETAWSGAGSGCSAYNPNPGWQVTSCGSMKANADVSAVADPNTGVSVYYNGAWYVFGGTSVSSPIIGSWLALNNANWSSTGNASKYVWSGPTWYDITSGSNGTCGATLCTAGTGWDGPTGLGSLPGSTVVSSKVATTTSVSPTSGSVAYGTTVSLVATVTPGDTGTATGTVSLTQGSTTLGSCTLSSTSPTACTISFTANLAAGTYALTATYSGDSNYLSSTAGNSLTVTSGTSTVPGVIASVTAATGSRKGTITASWQAPSTGGSPITGYLVKVFTSTGSLVAQGTVTSTSVVVSRLNSSALYYVTVAAQNAVGTQPTATQSNTVSAK